MPTFALVVMHAAHKPERTEPYRRLREMLGVHRTQLDTGLKLFEPVTEQMPNHELAERCWVILAKAEATHGVLLQDDVVPCPDFWAVLRKVVEAQADHLIALNNCAPVKPWAIAADKAGLRWVTSCDGLVGHGYVMPTAAFGALLDWRSQLSKETREGVNEDTLIDLWAMHRKLLVWHPVPALIEHDSSLPSAYGTKDLAGLRAGVPPREGMAELEWKGNALHAGRAYMGNHRLLLTYLHGPDWRERVERYYELDGRRA